MDAIGLEKGSALSFLRRDHPDPEHRISDRNRGILLRGIPVSDVAKRHLPVERWIGFEKKEKKIKKCIFPLTERAFSNMIHTVRKGGIIKYNISKKGGKNMAKKPMTKGQFVGYMAEKIELSKKNSVFFLDEMVALAKSELKKAGSFVLPGVGKLVLSKRKARVGRNPATGEEIKIPAKTVVKMRIAKAFKEAVIPPK